MSLQGIITFTARAFILALPIALLIMACRYVRRRKSVAPGNARSEILYFLFILYLLMLVEITVVRDGAHLLDFWNYPHGNQTIQLILLTTTYQEIVAGLWSALYHILGNMVWFIPLGVFLRVLYPQCSAGKVAMISTILSCTIECLQWVLLSGISDIDDVLWNVCGGVAGFELHRLWKHICSKRS